MEIEQYIVSDDAALVDMVLGGDNHAFEHLFDRYGGALHQIYLGRTGGNSDDTNDLIQEIFVKAYLKLDSYDRRYAFGQWIYTIARNTFIDYVRKRRDDLSIDNTRGEYIRQPVSQTLNPEESIINVQQRRQIEENLEKMSSKYRRLIELRFFNDLSYEEIAEQLKLPLGTVKTQIHRARTQLCDYITKSGM
ncbi:MAG: sigma-70 family RNA polymerase sigma factor [Alistipes sp.]|jgi:RNA polymerase sigma-70 factor (ECF subfamily)|nr:sigma-70 family RNA polymerase sigma factor [Alistipes sp.]